MFKGVDCYECGVGEFVGCVMSNIMRLFSVYIPIIVGYYLFVSVCVIC